MIAIEIIHLSYSFPGGFEALRDISLSLKEGERLGVIGPNGAGKSTLLWHLNGLLPDRPPRVPAIHIMGIPVIERNFAQIRAMVGLLFQDPDDQLFCPTVWEDVAFGPQQLYKKEPELSKIVNNALFRAGLVGFENRNTEHLSQGEKHRVCLAGVLACDAKILLLDEPTSDLDPRGRRELKAVLNSLPVTQVIASHDLEFIVETCNQALVLDNGQIISQGSTIEILNDEELMLAHGLERPHILRHLHPH
jgi:cobalt/nickel transport system ATP-binding protein